MEHLIGYAYEADVHCIVCTKARHATSKFTTGNSSDHGPGWDNTLSDENGIPFGAIDAEGNAIWPMLSTDKEAEDGEYCSDCSEMISEPVVRSKPMFTRQHYEAIAHTLGKCPEGMRRDDIAIKLAHLFKKDNPSFGTARFDRQIKETTKYTQPIAFQTT